VEKEAGKNKKNEAGWAKKKRWKANAK